MSANRLGELMRSVAVPDATDARERTVTAARAAAPPGSPALVRRRRGRLAVMSWRRGASSSAPRAIALACAAALVAGTLLTPPGRAALSEAAELLGQIGGAPTVEDDRGLEPALAPGEAGGPTVVDNGRAPDGSRYEWVAYQSHEQGLGKVFCVTFGWADAPRREGTGGCASSGGWSPGVVKGFGGRLIRPPGTTSDERAYMLLGSLSPRVHRLRILYRHPDGSRHDLPVDVGRVEGPLLRKAGGTRPFVTFVAFIPGETVRAHRLDERYRLASLTTVQGSAKAVPGLDRDPFIRCMRRSGGLYRRGWVHLLAYDAHGRRIASLPTLTGRPWTPECRRVYEEMRVR
jgi:hypothetical protein